MKSLCFDIFMVIFIIILSCNSLISQETNQSPHWSITVFGNYNMNYGVSPSMNGNFEQILNDYIKYSDISKYPVSDNAMKNYMIGLSGEYRFNESNFSIYSSFSTIFFRVNNYYNKGDNSINSLGLDIQYAKFYTSVFSIGCKYTIGDNKNLWNFFGKLGLNSSLFYGDMVSYFTSPLTFIPPSKHTLENSFRAGIEAEIGGRLNIPTMPLFIEFATNYSNLNLIGKSRQPANPDNSKIYLNDAANPDYPNIKSKTIDFLIIKIGVGYYL